METRSGSRVVVWLVVILAVLVLIPLVGMIGIMAMDLVLFSVLRFMLFFVRGDVPIVALGLENGHWTALAILLVMIPILLVWTRNPRAERPA